MPKPEAPTSNESLTTFHCSYAITSAAIFMDGLDVAFKDRVGAFQPTSGGFNWNQAANSFDANFGSINFGGILTTTGTNGTAQVSSNRRVAVTVKGVTNNLIFYLSSPGTGFMVQEDSNVAEVPNHIGAAFTQQASQ